MKKDTSQANYPVFCWQRPAITLVWVWLSVNSEHTLYTEFMGQSEGITLSFHHVASKLRAPGLAVDIFTQLNHPTDTMVLFCFSEQGFYTRVFNNFIKPTHFSYTDNSGYLLVIALNLDTLRSFQSSNHFNSTSDYCPH